MLKEKLKSFGFVNMLALFSLLWVGGFSEYVSCLISVAACGYLLYRLKKNGKFTVRKDFLTSSVIALCLGYALSCFWAVDRGMAFVGFLKFLPLALYLLCLQQEENSHKLLTVLPFVGAAMAVISFVGMQLPLGKELFSVAGRLAGFFQYPNTFAIFLLVSQLLCLKKPEKTLWDYLLMAVLLVGLLLTGSRTAFVVAALANLAMLVAISGKNLRKILLIGVAVAAVLAIGLLLGENSVLRRYLTISLTESTFVGRVLYWVDALPLLLRYPFGMGYMGYFYTQQSIQTGVYAVTYIHNDFLQLLLDVGFLPWGLFIGALIGWFLKKDIPATDKILVGAICLHSFFEFNLQFIGIFLLLITLLSQNPTEKRLRCKPKKALSVLFAVILAVSGYMAIALGAAHWGALEPADTLYPFNTQNKLTMLENEQDMEKANLLAEEILRQNSAFYLPYSVKARYCYTKGNFGAVIENQRKALEKGPFNYSEYEAYCTMLMQGVQLYRQSGDENSARICEEELIRVSSQLAQCDDRLSFLGKLIVDQPTTELPAEIQRYIQRIEVKP